MVIEIQAKIDVGSMRRNSTSMMSIIDASLPKLIEQVIASNHRITTYGDINDVDGNLVGEVVVSLAPRTRWRREPAGVRMSEASLWM